MPSPTVASSLLMLLVGAVGSAQAQQTLWGQCGGIGWSGQTTCASGSYCFHQNDWYFQCIPGAGPTTAAPTPTTTPSGPTTLSTSTTSSAAGTTTSPTSPGGGGGGSETCPSIPSGLGSSVSTLNDPFTFAGGSKVTTKAQWACRQEEISQLFQKYELGTLPPKPTVSASLSGNSLSITASTGGKSVSFSVTINKPSGSGPFPAIIAYGAASIPIPAGVATIVFNNDDIATQQDGSSRGKGKFYTLYGSGHSAGALTAWAWGVSRIIDALELTKATSGIDPARIGVTGCSRNGKGAFVAGALEPRIALTLPQESGAGGAGCWRLENWQNANGYKVQDAQEIVGENVWFSPNFNSYVNNVNQLPFDHHMLAALVSPRPLYIMENPDFEWLGKISTYGCMGAARKQYQALGQLDKFGFSQVGGHNHCSFPSAQSAELNAFIGKFLLGNANAGTTSVYRTDQSYSNFNLDTWTPWTVPSLA
ncbi:hypothetical protein B0H66DRAFT_615537 [Apodospora peruviana]|uniref:(4-O-methyl)-D-glucuronate--lignin esterase n=1 Tax=Apodospora peruviana TaxID=516989 RepID=A0AAE0IHD0_9PEZI|nr:hypothetical protein B0H66DRAFT_615537 [Apodospora peruviana]